MHWLYLLGAVLCMVIAFTLPLPGLAAVVLLLATLGLMIAWMLGWLSSRVSRNSRDEMHIISPEELRLLREQVDAGRQPKLFLASTSEVYGKNPKPSWTEEDDLVLGPTSRPRWAYGASKAIDEFLALAYARQFGLQVVVGRFFNVVGPRQTGRYGMVLPRFVDAALSGQPLVVHDDGQQTRCFAHVADVVAAVLALVDTPAAAGGVFNIGSDRPVTILELARRVIAASGSSSAIEFQTYAEAYSPDFEDVRARVPDLTKLRGAINYRPRFDLDQMIAAVIADKRVS